MQARRLTTRSPRSGFTMIEMLVVIGIIAILASVAFVAARTFVGGSQEDATKVLVDKIDKLIIDRLGAIDRYFTESDLRASKDGVRVRAPEYLTQAEKNSWANNVMNRPVIELAARKNFIRRNLPMRFAELDLNADGTADVTPPASHTPETEHAEVLYYFLVNSAQYGSDVSGLGEFSASETADTDNDGLLELVDAWGRPLRFYRWPTRLIRPQPAGSESNPQTDMNATSVNTVVAAMLVSTLPAAATLTTDPDDPLLVNPLAFSNPGQFETIYHTARTWHVPIVISAGPDGELGLYEPTDLTRRGHLAQPKSLTDSNVLAQIEDNISSKFVRVGGR